MVEPKFWLEILGNYGEDFFLYLKSLPRDVLGREHVVAVARTALFTSFRGFRVEILRSESTRSARVNARIVSSIKYKKRKHDGISYHAYRY